ncbi:MAG: hypothetical protein NVS3B28_19590 [Candidatus Velthaea sp.]
MSDLQALAYADWRGFVNSLRTIRQAPGRLALWTIYSIVIVVFIITRIRTPFRAGGMDIARADYLLCIVVAFLLFTFAYGKSALGIFRSRAEAHFIIGSPVRAPLAAAYLLARDSFARMSRTMTSSLYALFIFAPRSIGAWQIVADVILIGAILIAGFAALVPRQLIEGAWRAVLVWFAAVLSIVLLLPAIRDAALAFPLMAPLAPFARAWLPPWHPGIILVQPNVLWLVLAVAAAAVAIATLSIVSRDAYPELFALSMVRIEHQTREAKRPGLSERMDAVRANQPSRRISSAGTAPPGVLVYIWTSALEFRRVSSVRITAIVTFACVAAGFGLARFARFDDGTMFGSIFSTFLTGTVLFSIVAASALAAELRRPLFWLSSARLFERLATLAISRCWKPAVCSVVFGAAFAFGGGSLSQTLATLVGLPFVFFLETTVGFASFALMPRDIDQRGPLALARVAVAYILVAPPVTVFAIAGFALDLPLPGIVLAAFIGLLESAALLAFAGWRLGGRIDRLAAV